VFRGGAKLEASNTYATKCFVFVFYQVYLVRVSAAIVAGGDRGHGVNTFRLNQGLGDSCLIKETQR
jgi:hypothetical protein